MRGGGVRGCVGAVTSLGLGCRNGVGVCYNVRGSVFSSRGARGCSCMVNSIRCIGIKGTCVSISTDTRDFGRAIARCFNKSDVDFTRRCFGAMTSILSGAGTSVVKRFSLVSGFGSRGLFSRGSRECVET